MAVDVRLDSIVKTYDAVNAVDSVNLEVNKGELLTLLGPSGCGKTTTLRIIAGFTRQDKGDVYLHDELMNDRPPNKRNIGMVFQNYALFPHMTVRQNVEFGLKVRSVAEEERYSRTKEILQLVGLEKFLDRYPSQLSGGQQQRVAVARALVIKPYVLLMDEPLSNLDLKIRVRMRIELRRIQKELELTAVYVTHDQGEALSMSDRVAVMNNGRLAQVSTPQNIYEKPNDSFVASFIGEANILEGRLTRENDAFVLETRGAQLKVDLQDNYDESSQTTGRIALMARPERLSLLEPKEDCDNVLDATVEAVDFIGPIIRYFVRLSDGTSMKIDETNTRGKFYSQNSKVKVHIPSDSLVPIGAGATKIEDA